MMKTALIILGGFLFIGCNNEGNSKQTADSATINTSTGNVSDGGPNNGRGDTNSYNRMNDKVNDSISKKDTLLKNKK
jgi:hypothetical protein